MRYRHIDPSRFRHSDEPRSKLKHQTARVAWEQLRGFIIYGKRRPCPAFKHWQQKLSVCLAKVEAGEDDADKSLGQLEALTKQMKEELK